MKLNAGRNTHIKVITVDPLYNELGYNEVPDIMRFMFYIDKYEHFISKHSDLPCDFKHAIHGGFPNSKSNLSINSDQQREH